MREGKETWNRGEGEPVAVFMAGGAPLLLAGRPRAAPSYRRRCAAREAGRRKEGARVSRGSATGPFIPTKSKGGRRMLSSRDGRWRSAGGRPG
jgi:hypothetical protein